MNLDGNPNTIHEVACNGLSTQSFIAITSITTIVEEAVAKSLRKFTTAFTPRNTQKIVKGNRIIRTVVVKIAMKYNAFSLKDLRTRFGDLDVLSLPLSSS